MELMVGSYHCIQVLLLVLHLVSKVGTCPNLRKMNLVVHYKTTVVEAEHTWVWQSLLRLQVIPTSDWSI